MKLLLQALRASCKLFSGVLRIISELTTWRVDRGLRGARVYHLNNDCRMKSPVSRLCPAIDEQRWLLLSEDL
jgi:hypothetical protein